MKDTARYLESFIQRDLGKKMVFLGGPRQCGKTTLAERVLSEFPYQKNRRGLYLNWDFDDDRQRILSRAWGEEDELVVLDELHKFPRWKTWLKGLYDKTKAKHRYLVTGSARMDVYRRGGDSLLGRYHHWRLHPFTLSELPAGISRSEGLRRLMIVGGFPEPFLDGSETEARRWRRERFTRILRDDIRDLEPLRSIQTLGLFAEMLRARVGAPVVLANIANELQISPKTAKHWLEVLERMYVVFTVRPLTRDIPRAILKPPKVFFYDNADPVADEGARFENLVATSLLKELNFREDRDGYAYELRYIRDKDGREVDFAVLKEGRIVHLVEAKAGEQALSQPLKYYCEKLAAPGRQIVLKARSSYSQGRIAVSRAEESLASFDWLG